MKRDHPSAGPTWSLAARLTACYAATAFLLIVLSSGFLYHVLVNNLDREDDEFLADKVQILRALLWEKPDNAQALQQEVEWERTASLPVRYQLRVLDDGGATILESPGMSDLLGPDLFPDPPAFGQAQGPGVDVRAPAGRSFRVLTARAAVGPPFAGARILHVALDRTAEEELLTRYRAQLWIVLTLAVALCAAAGHQIARRGLQPVAAMSETVRRIRSTSLRERFELPGLPAELFVLAGAFNEMLDRLERSFQRLTQFSADIAHELRTPVNNLRGEAEVALDKARTPEEYRDVLGSCLEECERLARLIDSLLFLARADDPQTQIDRRSVDVTRELETVRAMYEATAAEAGVRWTVAAAGAAHAELDRTLFHRALGNLVANAVAHTGPGGSIRLAASTDGTSLHVEVSDTGSGIPPEHLPKVWDRFYRADAARSGEPGRVGIGLAIVKSIVTLHGGSVEITSQVGRGTRVSLRFPLSRGAGD
jgi:two-component system heavy metal sensor histidine kinase CusS